MCQCGYTREQHLEEATKPDTFQGTRWDPKKHVQEMPTDAFGDIVFTGLSQEVKKVGFHHSCSELWVELHIPTVTRGGWHFLGQEQEAGKDPGCIEPTAQQRRGWGGALQGKQEMHPTLGVLGHLQSSVGHSELSRKVQAGSGE